MPVYEAAVSEPAEFDVDKIATKLEIEWDAPTKVRSGDYYYCVKGDTVSFRVRLKERPSGNPIPGKKVSLLRIKEGETRYVKIKEGTTDDSGEVNFENADDLPTEEMSVWYWASFGGDEVYYSCQSETVRIEVESRVPRLTLSLPSTGVAGEEIVWCGTIRDPKVTSYYIGGKSIYLQESTDGETWEDVAGPVTSSDTPTDDINYSGTYRLPSEPGVYYYRSRSVAGSKPHMEAGVSKPVKLRVLAPGEKPPIPWKWIAVGGAVLVAVGALAYLRRRKAF